MSETIETKAPSKLKHLPTLLLGLIVAAIFVMAIFTYQVAESEKAIVKTLGDVTAVMEPGIHFRWPLPIQEINKYDIRLNSFDGNIGKFEELTTKDERNVVIGIFVIYKISDLVTYEKAAKSKSAVEEYLSNRMRTVKGGVIGKYRFDEMINTDPEKMKLEQIKEEMLEGLKDDMMTRYGIDVISVGIRSIGLPEKSALEVAKMMKQERTTAAGIARSVGKTKAEAIKTEADQKKKEIISNAEAKAKTLMAEGDAEAAKSLSIFNQEPELAAFLQKLDALRNIVNTKTTLILDTESTPFDVFSQMKNESSSVKKNDK